MLTLYGDLDSGNVYKARLILAHRGVVYRRVDTTAKSRRTAKPRISRHQPDRQHPDIGL